jgi:hypothetical protein
MKRVAIIGGSVVGLLLLGGVLALVIVGNIGAEPCTIVAAGYGISVTYQGPGS